VADAARAADVIMMLVPDQEARAVYEAGVAPGLGRGKTLLFAHGFNIHFREIRIHGAYGRGTAFRRALALLPKLGVKRLIGARFPLARIEEAFAHAAAGRGAKTVVTPA